MTTQTCAKIISLALFDFYYENVCALYYRLHIIKKHFLSYIRSCLHKVHSFWLLHLSFKLPMHAYLHHSIGFRNQLISPLCMYVYARVYCVNVLCQCMCDISDRAYLASKPSFKIIFSITYVPLDNDSALKLKKAWLQSLAAYIWFIICKSLLRRNQFRFRFEDIRLTLMVKINSWWEFIVIR